MNFKIFIVSIVVLLINFCNISQSIECLSQIEGDEFYIHDGFCAWEFTGSVTDPRQMITVSNGDILVKQANSVTVLFDENQDGIIGTNEMVVLASVANDTLTHSVAVYGEYVYASSRTTIYRWPYTPGKRTPISTPYQVVIRDLPQGGHITRTIVFDEAGVLYFSIGSLSNVDLNSTVARVYQCDIDLDAVPEYGYVITHCQVWADGTRNEVGLRFDSSGGLWGVENGIDNLSREDMTPSDIHLDNPCEELNYFQTKGDHYGYPYCFSEGILPAPYGLGNRTQWVVEQFVGVTDYTDTRCRDEDVVKPPKYCMPAHSAPLDLLFYQSETFPDQFKSGLFVTQHGSWNRSPPSGYQVVHISFNLSDNIPVQGSMTKIIGAKDNGIKWGVRPVSLAKLSPCGPVSECLLFSSDDSNSIYAIAAAGSIPTQSPQPSSSSSEMEPSTSHTIIKSTLSLVFLTLISILLL